MSNSNRTSNFGPRVSFTTTKSDPGPVHVAIPSGGTLTVAGRLNASGNANFTGTFAVGSGISLASIQRSVVSINPGAVAAHDSVQTTATVQTLPADAIILSAQPASIWSGAYHDLAITATVSAASTIRVGLANSTLTSVTPDAMNWTFLWCDPA